jgi:cation diffusion facilitator CzcD-associated flavoprotein CzcO
LKKGKYKMTKVCVIGAGPSGITALKNLLDQGLDAVSYDLNSQVGGNWVFNEKVGHSSVFESGAERNTIY